MGKLMNTKYYSPGDKTQAATTVRQATTANALQRAGVKLKPKNTRIPRVWQLRICPDKTGNEDTACIRTMVLVGITTGSTGELPGMVEPHGDDAPSQVGPTSGVSRWGLGRWSGTHSSTTPALLFVRRG
jgi:hypothetical protein